MAGLAEKSTDAPPRDSMPEGDVVLYDGHCSFCQAQMKSLRKWDRRGRLSYLPLQDEEVARRWPDISRERLQDEMCVVDSEGNCHWGADAVRYLSRRLPKLWWLAPLLHVPGSMKVWRPMYRLVARNRYRIWGRTEECDSGTCKVHGGKASG